MARPSITRMRNLKLHEQSHNDLIQGNNNYGRNRNDRTKPKTKEPKYATVSEPIHVPKGLQKKYGNDVSVGPIPYDRFNRENKRTKKASTPFLKRRWLGTALMVVSWVVVWFIAEAIMPGATSDMSIGIYIGACVGYIFGRSNTPKTKSESMTSDTGPR